MNVRALCVRTLWFMAGPGGGRQLRSLLGLRLDSPVHQMMDFFFPHLFSFFFLLITLGPGISQDLHHNIRGSSCKSLETRHCPGSETGCPSSPASEKNKESREREGERERSGLTQDKPPSSWSSSGDALRTAGPGSTLSLSLVSLLCPPGQTGKSLGAGIGSLAKEACAHQAEVVQTSWGGFS